MNTGKTCRVCGKCEPSVEFYPKQLWCKNCRRAYQREYKRRTAATNRSERLDKIKESWKKEKPKYDGTEIYC